MKVEIDTLSRQPVDNFSCKCKSCGSDKVELELNLEAYKEGLELKESSDWEEIECRKCDGTQSVSRTEYNIGEYRPDSFTGHTSGNTILKIVCTECKIQEDIRIIG